MTLDKIVASSLTPDMVVELDSKSLESLTDADLQTIYGQALNVTRPEYAGRVVNEKAKVMAYVPPAKKRALEMLQAEGIDLSFLNNKRKK